MNHRFLSRPALLLAFVFVFAACFDLTADPEITLKDSPQVLKIEPPNWWIHHSINPVRLLVRGRNLQGARVESSDLNLKTGLVRVNNAGTYLFVDVWIAPQTEPGLAKLKIIAPSGQADIPFEVSTPLSSEGRFQGFSNLDILYLLMPDRFANGDPSNDDPPQSRGMLNRSKARYYHGGDFQGVMDHLGYLKDLGVTAIWMNPIYDNVNHLNERETYNHEAITDYHGYGAIDYYGVEEHFGTLPQFRGLVDAAHRMGIKILQDQVANHTGPYHPWVKDSPTPTWYNGTEKEHLANTWQTWTLMDPHASAEVQKATLEGWFIDILPDLNQNDEETARYLIQNTLWWIGMTGIDGIRQDTLPYVPRRFWRDWMAAIKKEYPGFQVIGELFDGNPSLVSFFQGGASRFDGIDSGIDALFDFPLFFPMRRAFGESRSIREVASMQAHDWLYPHPEKLVTFLGLHDVARFMNENGASQAGLKLAFTFLMTSRGIPMIYYGDEIGMLGGIDPDNRRDFPGGWKEDPNNCFLPEGRNPQQQALWEYLQKLIRLRKQLEPLKSGSTINLLAEDQQYVFARISKNQSIVVALNNSAKESTLEVDVKAAGFSDGAVLEDQISGLEKMEIRNGMIHLKIPGRSSAILVKQ